MVVNEARDARRGRAVSALSAPVEVAALGGGAGERAAWRSRREAQIRQAAAANARSAKRDAPAGRQAGWAGCGRRRPSFSGERGKDGDADQAVMELHQ
jgi:hypothetical protein